jgi:hypothetical protein
MSQEAERKGLAEPFVGITSAGEPARNLFPLRSSGVSTEPVRKAAARFIASLSKDQAAKTRFGVDDDEWRKWMNPHFYVRQGISIGEMPGRQRTLAFELLESALSARGLKLTGDVMRLNETLAELKNDFVDYGEGRYWITLMGEPSKKEPWGFQLDGHHLILNYFVLGDQVVMTPAFWGSEPVVARTGRYKGTAILKEETEKGLAMVNALSSAQLKEAVLSSEKSGNNNIAEAFRDNVVLDFAGIRGSDLSSAQKHQLLDLVGLYVHNMKEGHARVKMDEVRKHIDDTYFAWIGNREPGSIFYYRVHSPVILIEFDHQKPVALGDRASGPNRDHIHTLVRTPNGNDYGKDLLRQHYEDHPHPHDH